MRHLKSIRHSKRGLIILLFLVGVSEGQLVTNNAVINGGTILVRMAGFSCLGQHLALTH